MVFFQVFFNFLLQLGRSYFAKSFLTFYFNLEEVIFGSLFWEKLFFQVFFNLLLLLGRSYFWKSFLGEVIFPYVFNLLLQLGRSYF